MKQFIYLDNDIVNSIISQKQQGLITNFRKETSNTNENSKECTIDFSADASIGGSILKAFNGQADLNIGTTREKGNNNTNFISEISEKIMHDAYYDIAYEYISPKIIKYNSSEFDNYGKYVEVKRVYDILDFEYLELLLSKNGIGEYYKKSVKNRISQHLNREQKRDNNTQALINDTINKEIKQFDEVSELVTMLKKIIPNEKMLLSSDGYLIPLDEKYFRVNSSNIGFMYGGEITCVGMITNIISSDTEIDKETNPFTILQRAINTIVKSLQPKQENLCIIHPIAVYYDNEMKKE